MRRHVMPRVRGNEVNVTPLIDVVMCLIIFFMLVAKIGVATGADETIKPPEAYLGTKLEDLGNSIWLNVRAPVGWEHTPVGAEYPEVTTVVNGEKKELPLVELGPDGKPRLIIGPDGKMTPVKPMVE